MQSLLLRFLRRVGLLGRITVKANIRLENQKFRIPVINGIGIDNCLTLDEPWIQFIYKKMLVGSKEGRLFIDIGVNLGQSLLRVKAVSREINYLGFEPNSACVSYVSQLIADNRLTNVQIVPVGISDQTAILKLRLFQNSDVDAEASIIGGFRDDSTAKKILNVPVFDFSKLSHLYNSEIRVIKIDVEGAELEVIRAIKSKLISDRPFVVLEVLPVYNSDNKTRLSRQNEMEQILKDVDYVIFRIIKNNLEFVEINQINEFGIHSDLNLCDYILCPTESKKEIMNMLSLL